MFSGGHDRTVLCEAVLPVLMSDERWSKPSAKEKAD